MLPLFKSLALAMVLLGLMILSPIGPIGQRTIHKVYATNHVVSLVGFAGPGWNNTNPTLTINQGDSLVITTSSGDSTPHHFFVDVDQDSMTPNCSVDKCAAMIPPTHTDTLTGFTAGNYFYYCEYHAAMKGTFIVQAPPPDFSVTLNPSSLTLNQGTSQTSTVTVASMNGFSGAVTFASPTTPVGITASLGSSTVSVTTTSPGTTTLTVDVGPSTATGQYTITITGSGGGNSHTSNLSLIVVKPDFGVSSDHSSLNLILGSSGTARLTVSSQNGFAGNVNLTVLVSPNGPSASLSPVTVLLAPGGSASSTLTITTSSGPYMTVTVGTYTVMVNTTSGPSLSHTTSLSMTLAPQSSGSPVGSLPAYVLGVVGLVIAAAILAVAYVVLTRRPRK